MEENIILEMIKTIEKTKKQILNKLVETNYINEKITLFN